MAGSALHSRMDAHLECHRRTSPAVMQASFLAARALSHAIGAHAEPYIAVSAFAMLTPLIRSGSGSRRPEERACRRPPRPSLAARRS